MSSAPDDLRREEDLELDEKELEPAALVFLTYPLALVAFSFLVFLVLWYLGILSHNEVDPTQGPGGIAPTSSVQTQ